MSPFYGYFDSPHQIKKVFRVDFPLTNFLDPLIICQHGCVFEAFVHKRYVPKSHARSHIIINTKKTCTHSQVL